MAETILEEAARITSGDRNQEYGPPLKDFERCAAMWSVIIGAPVKPQQVALCMIALKISRQINKPKRDNLVDICGYARTLEMCEDEIVSGALGDEHEALTFGEY